MRDHIDGAFEWDIGKAGINLKKHRVSFELARRVFADPLKESSHPYWENGELRTDTLGVVADVVLIVTATEREYENQSSRIRIISARKADKSEREHYFASIYD